MTTRTITVHDRCTGCERVLLSISEGQRGTCSSCWFKSLRPEKARALNRLVEATFNGNVSEQHREDAVRVAVGILQEEGKVVWWTSPRAVDEAVEQLDGETP